MVRYYCITLALFLCTCGSEQEQANQGTTPLKHWQIAAAGK